MPGQRRQVCDPRQQGANLKLDRGEYSLSTTPARPIYGTATGGVVQLVSPDTRLGLSRQADESSAARSRTAERPAESNATRRMANSSRAQKSDGLGAFRSLWFCRWDPGAKSADWLRGRKFLRPGTDHGPWPPLIEKPASKWNTTPREHHQQQIRIEILGGEWWCALLEPEGDWPEERPAWFCSTMRTLERAWARRCWFTAGNWPGADLSHYASGNPMCGFTWRIPARIEANHTWVRSASPCGCNRFRLWPTRRRTPTPFWLSGPECAPTASA